jgi:hypothetical protein
VLLAAGSTLQQNLRIASIQMCIMYNFDLTSKKDVHNLPCCRGWEMSMIQISRGRVFRNVCGQLCQHNVSVSFFCLTFFSIFSSAKSTCFLICILCVPFSGQTVSLFSFPFRSSPDQQNISPLSALIPEHIKGLCNTLRIRKKRRQRGDCSAQRRPPRQQDEKERTKVSESEQK